MSDYENRVNNCSIVQEVRNLRNPEEALFQNAFGHWVAHCFRGRRFFDVQIKAREF
jgi:hypothetical protein